MLKNSRLAMASTINQFEAVKECTFFNKLPFELRQIIFHLVLRRPHIALGDYQLTFKRLASPDPAKASVQQVAKHKPRKQRKGLALLLVCKAMHDEAMQVLYSTRILSIYLSGTCVSELPLPTTEGLKRIQHIELYIVAETQAAMNYFQYLAHI